MILFVFLMSCADPTYTGSALAMEPVLDTDLAMDSDTDACIELVFPHDLEYEMETLDSMIWDAQVLLDQLRVAQGLAPLEVDADNGLDFTAPIAP